MALIAIRNFKGEIPKTPTHLLPDGAASAAINCDFSRGDLRPFKQGEDTGLVASVGPVTSLYVRDATSFTTGNPPQLKWYSSPAHTEKLHRSPVIDDTFNRVYMIAKHAVPGLPGQTTNAHLVAFTWDNAQGNGGEPIDTFPFTGQAIVGVPTPTVAPTLTTETFVNALPGIAQPKFRLRCWWESDGVRYQETTWNDITAVGQTVSPAGSTGAGNASHPSWATQFIINPPGPDIAVDAEGEEVDGRTPTDAYLGVELRIFDGTQLLLAMNTTTKATVPARSSALPGGLEMVIYKTNPDQNDRQYDVRLSWGIIETRAYCFTVVNEWNEESAPSPPTLVSVRFIDKVKAACRFPIMRRNSGSRLFYYQKRKLGASGINLYRTFGGSANYLKVKHGTNSTYDRSSAGAAIAGDTTTNYPTVQNDNNGTGVWSFVYDEVHTPSDVSSALISMEWEAPPDGDETDILARSIGQPQGLTLMQNGWFAMFRNNTLYMSEPYRPHTWPYSMTFPSNIKAICAGAQALVVATQDSVYLVNGNHPASVSQMRLPVPVGGVSQLGICNVEGAVALVTNDGILLINGSQADFNMSQQLFTRDVWRSRYGASLANMRLDYHDGFLVASFSDGTVGFAVRTDEAPGSFTRHALLFYGSANYPSDDSLIYTTNTGPNEGRRVYKFRGEPTSSYMTAYWLSKEHTFQKPESMGAFYIRCAGPVNVSIYLEGVLYHTAAVTGTGYYRIPAAAFNRDGRGLRWSVALSLPEASGIVPTVSEFLMAQTMAELKSA